MGRKIYSKPIKELCEEFAGQLAHNETFIPRRAVAPAVYCIKATVNESSSRP